MTSDPIETQGEAGRERHSRVRIGVTGLAFIFVAVLLAASFSGSATDEPALTADTRNEVVAEDEINVAGDEAIKPPQEPLAELGVAPGAAATDAGQGQSDDPANDTGIAESLEELDATRN